MAILPDLLNMYETYKQGQRADQQATINNALNQLKLWTATHQGGQITPENGGQAALQAIQQAQKTPEGIIPSMVHGLQNFIGKGQPQQPLQSINLPGTPYYSVGQGGAQKVGELPFGAQLVPGMNTPHGVETYVSPDGKHQSPPMAMNDPRLPELLNNGWVTQSKYAADAQRNATQAWHDTEAGNQREHNDILRKTLEDKSRPKYNAMQQAAINAFVDKNKRQPSAQEMPEVLANASAPTVGIVSNPNPNLTGENSLQNYTPQVQTLAKKLVKAEIPYPSAFAIKDPLWKTVIQAAADYDPGFNAAQYQLRSATRKSFTSGPDAKNITSINTLVGHLDSLNKSARQLENAPYRLWNTIANKGLTETGDSRVTKFNMDLGAVESELASIFKQTGATNEEIAAWRARINSSDSPEQLQAAIKEAVSLMGSRLEALKSKYEAGMGPFSQMQILSPKSRKTLANMVGQEEVDRLEPDQEKEKKPPLADRMKAQRQAKDSSDRYNEWLKAAKKSNPKASESELKAYYEKKYGGK